MHFNTLALAVVFSFGAIDLVQAGSSSTLCYTRLSKSKPPHKPSTYWTTSYTPCTSTKTSVITVTSTPKQSTSTKTVTTSTTSTGSSLTETSTASSTVTTTGVITATSTSTITETISSTSTSTVPTSAGFVPVQTSLPGSTYSGSGGSDPVGKRALEKNTNLNKRSGRGSIFGKNPYPWEVNCWTWSHHSCQTKVTTIKSTKTAPASTTTITTTSTLIVTINPTATTTTTSTFTTGTTSTATTTSTETDTVTSVISTTTVYAACATSNFADTYQGQVIGGVGGTFDTENVLTTDTVYDCCVAALLNPNADVFAYIPDSGGAFNCAIVGSVSCTSQAAHPFTAQLGDAGAGQATTGNGYCGEVNAA